MENTQNWLLLLCIYYKKALTLSPLTAGELPEDSGGKMGNIISAGSMWAENNQSLKWDYGSMSLLGPCMVWTQIWEMGLSWKRTWKLERALRWVFQVIELWFSCNSIRHPSPTRSSSCMLSNMNHPAEAQSGDDITCVVSSAPGFWGAWGVCLGFCWRKQRGP